MCIQSEFESNEEVLERLVYTEGCGQTMRPDSFRPIPGVARSHVQF